MTLATFVHELKPTLMVLLLPPVPLLALVVMGAGLLRQHRWAGRFFLTLGLVGLWLSGSEGAGQWLSLHLVKSPPALSAETLAALQAQPKQAGMAVLVLGGGARSDVPEYQGPGLLAPTHERLRYGIWLARRTGAPLAFSGGIGWQARHLQVSEASVAEQVAREIYGLPLQWSEGRSRDTRENAAFSHELLKAHGVKTVLLVTHDLHMPRALQAFREAVQGQIEIVPAPVGLRRDAMSEFSDWTPSAEGFARVRYAVYEWLGRLAGR